jgi:purine-nucleoside phosphorylase
VVAGKLEGKYVLCFNGRFHSYEHDMDLHLCAVSVRIMHEFGVKNLIVSSAAGGVNPSFRLYDLMVVKDHLFVPGLAGFSPLVGLGPEFGSPFVSMHDAYDEKYR